MGSAAGRQGDAHVPIALLAVAVVIFGTGYWPTAVAADHGPSIMVTTMRVATSALMLLAIAAALRLRLPRGDVLRWAVLTGLLTAVIFQWGLTESVARAGAGNAAVMINTNPLMVLALAWIFLQERLHRVGVVGLLAGFGGVVLMVATQLGGSVETSELLIGSAIALVAAFSFAVSVLIVRRISQRPGGIEMVGFTAVQFSVASVLFVPIAFALEGTSGTDWGSDGFWASTAWTGPGAAVAAVFFYLALKRLPAAKTSSALFLVPAVAIIVEIARGNAPDALALSGMLVTVVGVALATVPREWMSALRARVRAHRPGAPPAPS